VKRQRTADQIEAHRVVHYTREALVATAEEWFATRRLEYLDRVAHEENEMRLELAVVTYQLAVEREALSWGAA
jgi:hypothetical protein